MTRPVVHDLLRIDPAIARRWDAPAWVEPALVQAPWVVVRRACWAAGIPIGVRGETRAQRFATWIEPSDECERILPVTLATNIGRGTDRLARATRSVQIAANTLSLRWGVAGAYGFELASGIRATHAASDLDIVVYAHPARAILIEFAKRCSRIERLTDVRIDADVLIGDTGVALAELVSDARVVLAKTHAGPVFIATPL